MIQYNTLKVKLSNSQLNRLKSGIKNATEVTSSDDVGDSNDENNFLHKLLLINAQVSNLCKAFATISSANINLSKTQLCKIGQPRRFLGRLLGPLLKTGLSLIRNRPKQLAKSVLKPLLIIAAASGTDGAIHKKMFRFGTATLIISNDEMNDIMKIMWFISKRCWPNN